jgi:hypothetical protein
LLLKLVSLEPLLDLPDWLERLSSLESRLGAGASQAPDLETVMPSPPAPLVQEAAPVGELNRTSPERPEPSAEIPFVDQQRWQSFLKFVEKHGGAPWQKAARQSGAETRKTGVSIARRRLAPAHPQHLTVPDLGAKFFGALPVEIEPFLRCTQYRSPSVAPTPGRSQTLAENFCGAGLTPQPGPQILRRILIENL